MAKYLAFDVGSKTIGIAKSDGFYPSTLKTIRFEENNFYQACELVEAIIKEENPQKIVIGYPKNMDNSIGHRAQMVEDFVSLLIDNKIWTEDKIEWIDERLTTKMARSILVEANVSRKKQKKAKDNLAAILILETFLVKISK
ncbi:Holliday junction resolvase RuvX [Spiroplasma endosymbiont of Aspidapion aeneum]|uniref:Holliday junction resolvase RuvX n=1 Tax=Spiroplasma endosymbiont of Aspidapion aeneum TaxID=3066276 RepID=UPI00313D23B3